MVCYSPKVVELPPISSTIDNQVLVSNSSAAVGKQPSTLTPPGKQTSVKPLQGAQSSVVTSQGMQPSAMTPQGAQTSVEHFEGAQSSFESFQGAQSSVVTPQGAQASGEPPIQDDDWFYIQKYQREQAEELQRKTREKVSR